MKPLTRRTRLLTALTAVTATAAAVLVVGPGYDTAQVRMRPGTVWLASGQTGAVTLVDGASAEVKAHVPVARAGTALTVVQRGSGAVVLNRETGQLSNVDSATEQVSPPVTVLPASDGLVALPAPDALYVADVHSGTVAAVDPATLSGEPRQLAETLRPDSVAVDGRGRLWAIDGTTGDLVWLSDGKRRTRVTAARSGRLAITDGKPALVDPGRGAAELLDPETGAVTRSVPLRPVAGDVVVSGSAGRARVLIADGGRGELVSCAFDTGCTAPLKVSSAGAELGTPVEVDDHAVVPDLSTGQVTIVDLVTSRVVAERRLFDRPTRFELITRDGIVFFNDPNGNTAGVLDLSGGTRTITKYRETPAAGDLPPTPDPRKQADHLTRIDHRKQKPGLGLPGQANPILQPAPPAPRPAASIVVRPGVHGVVGDEFELTMVLHPSGPASATWSFGDETPAVAGATVRHRWQRPGTFTVRAAAPLGNGRTAESETAVTVTEPGAPPRITHIDVRRPRPVIGESVHFSANTTGQPDSWRWTVTRPGAATPEVTADTAAFSHRFAAPGVYTVSLTTTAGGRTAHSSRQFTVSRGAVEVWGQNFHRQAEVPETASIGVVAVDGGMGHCLALRADGAVIAWGDDSSEKTEVPDSALSGVIAIAAGSQHSLALKADGSVITWGAETADKLAVPPEATRDVIAIAAGDAHSLALTANGKVIAWGDDTAGQSTVPHAATSRVIRIAAGRNHSLALTSDGAVLSWGDSGSPSMQVPLEATRDVVAIAAGDNRSLAQKRDGSIIRWGFRWEEEPLVPPAAQSGVISFDTGYEHVLALKADGSVIGWGIDHTGETSLPPQHRGRVLAVAAADHFSLVVVEGPE